MDKGTFASYKFKPSDVIEGLNRYFAGTKAYRYRRVSLEIRNGEVKLGNYYVIRNIVFDVNPKFRGYEDYYIIKGLEADIICDPEEVVGVAINWLREEHDIFYTPGMEVPVEDFDVDEAVREYEKATRKDRVEELRGSWSDIIAALQKRLSDTKRRIVALEEGHAEKSKIIDRQVARIKDLEKQLHEAEERFDSSKKAYESLKEFRDSVCEILDIPYSMADDQEQILKEIHDFADRYYELRDFRADICGVLDIDGTLTETIYKLKNRLDCNARFRSNICTALCLGCEMSDEDILKRIRMAKECHDKLCKDYTELRKAIWEAMDRKPETLPDETSRLVGEVTELARGEKLLIEFRDAVAEAIGIMYPTTNQFIVSRVADIYKERGEAHDLAMELDRKCIDLTAKNSDLQQKFEFQSGLRQQWYARYESEHERANDVQKALDREREKCRVKDISLETAKKQYEKVCGNLETTECALNGMKSKVRSLREEKTKVITALGQDVWDDCLK